MLQSLKTQDESKTDANPPSQYSVVAVHGLGSNPTTTWQSRTAAPGSDPVMWLRDFLPKEDIGVRVLLFSHNTQWDTAALNKSLYDHAADLLRFLERNRQTGEVSGPFSTTQTPILIDVPRLSRSKTVLLFSLATVLVVSSSSR